MTDFESDYLNILMRQVNEEIEYLVRNGHSDDKNFLPCMFCIKHDDRHYYRCERLKSLREFQSILAVKGGRDIPKELSEMGKMVDNHIEDASNYLMQTVPSSTFDLPPLLQPL